MSATPSNSRLLVIDDNRAIHEDFRKVLGPSPAKHTGLDAAEAELFGEDSPAEEGTNQYHIDSAYQGAEGIDLVAKAAGRGEPYAMAFVDVRMPPGLDGIETTAKIWQVDPDIQVVICTAYSDYSWGEMLHKLGQSDRLVILKKPFDTIEVAQLANSLTRKWQLLQETKTKLADLERMVEERTAEMRREHEERNQMEIHLRQAQKLESVGQLAAGIAHEINTPIQYIGDNIRFVQESFADLSRLLADHQKLRAAARAGSMPPGLLAELEASSSAVDVPYLMEEIPAAIRQSLEGVGHVANIVRAMKEFSHPGNKEKVLLNINHAIETTLTVARNEWKYVADVTTHLAPGLPAVPCLPGEFNQVILNLVVNAAHAIGDAIKQTPNTKGVITVATAAEAAAVRIDISDTGAGIPQGIQHRIFEPFFTTKIVGKGTGQGLAIAHSTIVKKHGGQISFESIPGRGTTFTIRLPLAGADKN